MTPIAQKEPNPTFEQLAELVADHLYETLVYGGYAGIDTSALGIAKRLGIGVGLADSTRKRRVQRIIAHLRKAWGLPINVSAAGQYGIDTAVFHRDTPYSDRAHVDYYRWAYGGIAPVEENHERGALLGWLQENIYGEDLRELVRHCHRLNPDRPAPPIVCDDDDPDDDDPDPRPLPEPEPVDVVGRIGIAA